MCLSGIHPYCTSDNLFDFDRLIFSISTLLLFPKQLCASLHLLWGTPLRLQIWILSMNSTYDFKWVVNWQSSQANFKQRQWQDVSIILRFFSLSMFIDLRIIDLRNAGFAMLCPSFKWSITAFLLTKVLLLHGHKKHLWAMFCFLELVDVSKFSLPQSKIWLSFNPSPKWKIQVTFHKLFPRPIQFFSDWKFIYFKNKRVNFFKVWPEKVHWKVETKLNL